MPLQHSVIYHGLTYDTAITVTESESDIRIASDTLYLAMMVELWRVYYEDFLEN